MGRHSDTGQIDDCDMPGCKTRGYPFTFVSFAINPETKKKGMLLCPSHERKEVKKHVK